MACSRPRDAYEIAFLSLHYCATAQNPTHIKSRINLDHIGELTGLKAANAIITQDGCALYRGHVDSIHQRNPTKSGSNTHTIQQVCSSTCNGFSLSETGNAITNHNVLRTEGVSTIGHAGSCHRIRNKNDVVAAHQLVNVTNQKRIDMDVVADEFSNSAAACGIGEELCDRAGVAVLKRAYPIEEVGARVMERA